MMLDNGPDRFQLWRRTEAGTYWLTHWREMPLHPKWLAK